MATSPTADAVAAPGWAAAIAESLRDIKLAHSVFALPFALLGAVLALAASDPRPGPATVAGTLALVVVCMVFARTWAMLVNRLADHRIDAENPRTRNRAIPAGRLSVARALTLAIAAALGFQLAAAGFWVAFGNPWPTLLGPVVLGWIALYSFTKRFTALCHLFLGGALAVSPIAAAIAVHPGLIFSLAETGAPHPTAAAIYWLAGFVLLWVAGFDIAYALQDLDYDRSVGLRSVPAALGWRGALWLARAFHLAALATLVAAGLAGPQLGTLFSVAVVIVAITLFFEHAVLVSKGLAGLPMAFFTLNGVVSMVLGGLGIADIALNLRS